MTLGLHSISQIPPSGQSDFSLSFAWHRLIAFVKSIVRQDGEEAEYHGCSTWQLQDDTSVWSQ